MLKDLPFTLSLQHLSFEQQQFPLWENITAEVRSGEILEVRGENGSGKTTLLRVIAGLITPHSGNILWRNVSINKNRERYQCELHYLGHLNSVKINLSVEENIHLQATLLAKKMTQSELDSIVQRVGLKGHQTQLARTLSAGQLRRLSLTKLLISEQPLWILDEPTNSLDKQAQGLVNDLLEEHVNFGGAAIIATHQKTKFENSKLLQLGKCHD